MDPRTKTGPSLAGIKDHLIINIVTEPEHLEYQNRENFPTGTKISREILGDKLFPLDYHLLRSPNWIIPIRF